MKPMLSYYGGKQRIATQIMQHFPPHSVYCEPFCGGAALLFAKPLYQASNNHNYREVVNDIDGNLINLYCVAVTKTDAFLEMVNATLYSRAEYYRSGEIGKNVADYDDITRAWAYYVSCTQSFSNSPFNGRGWSQQQIGRNNPCIWQSKLSQLPIQIQRLQHVYIECQPALDVIQTWDSPQTLFYLDPPYPGANQGHYSGYTIDDWCGLCDLLDTISGSYVLSNYPQEIEPQSAQRRIEIEATMSAANGANKKRTEMLWICNRSKHARPDLKPILKQNQKALQRLLNESQPRQSTLFDTVQA